MEDPEDLSSEIGSIKHNATLTTFETHLCRQLQKEDLTEKGRGCRRYIQRYLADKDSSSIKPSDVFPALLAAAEKAVAAADV